MPRAIRICPYCGASYQRYCPGKGGRCPECRLAQQDNYKALRTLEPGLLSLFRAAESAAREAVRIIESSPKFDRSRHRELWAHGGVLHRVMRSYHVWSAILRLLDEEPDVCPAAQTPGNRFAIPLPPGAWLEARLGVRLPCGGGQTPESPAATPHAADPEAPADAAGPQAPGDSTTPPRPAR